MLWTKLQIWSTSGTISSTLELLNWTLWTCTRSELQVQTNYVDYITQVNEIKPLPRFNPTPPQVSRSLHIAMLQALGQVRCAFLLEPTTPVVYAIAAVGPYWKWTHHTTNPGINDTSTTNNIVYELNTVASALQWQAIFADLQAVYNNFPDYHN